MRSSERDAFFVLSSVAPSEERIRALRTGGVDWNEAARIAFQLECPQVFYSNLKRYGFDDSLSPETAVRFKQIEFETAARNLSWQARLLNLGELLDAHGVPFIVIKGLSLVLRTYRDERLRRSVDVDLLIRPEDFTASAEAFKSVGGRVHAPMKRGVMVNPGQECTVIFADGGEVDLHYRFFPWYEEANLYRVESRAFYERSVAWEWRGRRYRLLRTEDEFCYCLMSFFASRFQAMRYLIDADALVRAHGSAWEWGMVRGFLETSPLRGYYAAILAFLTEKIGTPLPEESVKISTPRNAAIGKWLFSEEPPRWRRRLFLIRAPGTWQDRLSVAGVYFRWQLFKAFGWFKGYFMAKNNPPVI